MMKFKAVGITHLMPQLWGEGEIEALQSERASVIEDLDKAIESAKEGALFKSGSVCAGIKKIQFNGLSKTWCVVSLTA